MLTLSLELIIIYFFSFVGGYFLGSVPFGLFFSHLAGLGDIRKIGSGNIGATNVLRAGNKSTAALTLLADIAKGFVAVIIFSTYDSMAPLIAAVSVIIGHNFPIWLKFKGGKGVATTLGVFLAVSWPVGLIACVTWLVSAVIFRISSLSSLLSLLISPFFMYFFENEIQTILAIALTLLAFLRHKANIKRLLKKEEPKIGKEN